MIPTISAYVYENQTKDDSMSIDPRCCTIRYIRRTERRKCDWLTFTSKLIIINGVIIVYDVAI